MNFKVYILILFQMKREIKIMKVFNYLAFILCTVSTVAMADTLSDVMAYTYENSLTLGANRAGLKAVDEKVAQAKSGYRPSVVGSADAARAKYENTYDNAAIANKQKKYLNAFIINLFLFL